MGWGMGKDRETALERVRGDRDTWRQRKGLRRDSLGVTRVPQKGTARNTESQKLSETETQRGRVRERYRPRETDRDVRSQGPRETEK